MGFDRETVATYNRAPAEFAEKFAGIGPRTRDIALAFKLVGNPVNPRVVEIGCGDGRDATQIVTRTTRYQGFDPSRGLLRIAKQRRLAGEFTEADALSFDYPDDIDIVFAFASLLHIDKDAMHDVFQTLHPRMKKGGIAFVSLKERAEYSSEVQREEAGDRLFYYYDIPTVQDAAKPGFWPVYERRETLGQTDWFELALRAV